MTWQPVSLVPPVSDASALGFGVTTEVLSPWTSDVREGSGSYTWLSFPNAVDALIERLQGRSVPALFVLAMTAGSYKDLASQCAAMAAAFPVKQIKQWQRQAQNLVTLAQDKLDLVDAVLVTGGIKLNAIPTVKTQMQKSLSVAAKASSEAMSNADPLSELDSFSSAKSLFDDAVNTPLPNITGGTGWRFYAETDITSKLKTGHPGHDYAFTALMAFVGTPADLAYLNEMMPEIV